MSEARSCVEGSANNPGHWAEDVPAGYRRTEVGVIPKDWDTGPMASIADIYSGATPSTQNPANWNGSIRWCVPTDITSDTTKYLAETSRSITQKGLQSSGATLLPVGALLLCSRATIGEVKIAATSLCTNQGFKSLVCKDDAYNEFLYYLLLTLKPRLKEKAAGSTFLEIGKNDLASIQIALPSYSEQCAIAEALSDVDELLESLDALIAKKRAIKQAAMQQLLTGTTRLPGFREKWEKTRLNGIGYFLKGSGITRDETSNEGLACIRYGQIYTKYDFHVRKFHSYIEPQVAQSSVRLSTGDLLFAGSGETKGEIGKCVAIISDKEAYAGGDIVILRNHSGRANSEFLGYALNAPYVARQKASYGQGDAVVHISARALSEVWLHLPSFDEQSAIATILSDMDAEITALEQRRDKTRVIKQGMMMQLLTGRVRLI